MIIPSNMKPIINSMIITFEYEIYHQFNDYYL